MPGLFKCLFFKGLVTARNIVCAPLIFKEASVKPAIHHDHLSRDVARRLAAQKHDHARHVLRLGHPPQDRLVLSALEHLARQRRQQVRLDESGATALTLMLDGPRSTAAERVSPIRAALLAA